MTPWVKRLIIANIIVFFLQMATAQSPGMQVTAWMEFIPRDIFVRPWTMITYMFVHDPNGFTHILFNMLGLYFFGPRVEERLGSNRFVALYLISGIAGAVLSWAFMSFTGGAAIIGASGAVLGVMFAFARFWPTAQIYIMGIIPLEARVAVVLLALYTIWSGFSGSRSGVADFAHLGGFAGAWLYLLWIERNQGAKKFRAKTTAPVGKETLGNWKSIDAKKVHEVNRDEVNRILDKISKGGLGTLTPQERLFLSNFVPMDDRIPPVS